MSTPTALLVQALRRDIDALLADYRSEAWVPSRAERDFAEGVARTRWDAPRFRDALREVPDSVRGSRLLDTLSPAAGLFDETVDPEFVAKLRGMVDAVASLP